MARRDKNILAGEYALGTLNAKDRAEAERLLAQDAGFARDVGAWERRLAPLSEALEPRQPPSSSWKRIEAALEILPAAREGALFELAGQLAELKRSLAVWRYATVSAVAAAVALALVWIGGLQSPFAPPAKPEERYVAMLQSEQGETGFVVTMDMNGMQFAIKPVAAKTPPDKSYELWCIMENGKPQVVTAGLVGTGAYAMMDAPQSLNADMLEKGVKLAVSLEPKGGSPKGKSMGPIMYAGLLVKQTP